MASGVGVEDKGGICDSIEVMVIVAWFSDGETML